MSIKKESEKIKLEYDNSYIEGKGIFNSKTRGKLLGIKTRGREPIAFKKPQDKADFWFARRESIKGGLKDIELFIEVADEESLNQVINFDGIKPLVDALLFSRINDKPKPNVNTVKIAQMLIHRSFQYLRRMNKNNIGSLHERAINEGLQICDTLANLLLPYGERWEHPRY
jgi:hypothetical protein